MSGPVTARSGNDRKQGRRFRVPLEVRRFSRMLLSCLIDIPSVLYHNWRLKRHNSVQPGNAANIRVAYCKGDHNAAC